MVRWMYNVRPDDRISAEELGTRLKLNSMKKCLQDKRLQWFGHLESMEENTNVEPSWLVGVYAEDHLGKHEIRYSEVV